MAIDDLLDEHEQGERVRRWLRANGAGLIGGVAIGLGLIAGWQWWQADRLKKQFQANEAYHALDAALQAKDLVKAKTQLQQLQGIYTQMGALQLAKAQLDAGQRDAAIDTLRTARTAEQRDLQRVIDERLARLLIDAGKSQEALTLLQNAGDDAAALEVRGDAQLALGQRDAARESYAKALTRLDVGAPQRRLVELKLSEAGGKPATPDSAS
ncbi:MAG: hypothetical protein DI635_06465 [Pseudoxanthomonas suwonensis]|nr:MAG: hypothetical protein DI635_06465 [Pseudoxanthomonas suwonensis]